ncbi:translation initiation factor IF-2-like isoform X2 [Pipistrellus kuhlii]|uniref:translation initiation factor IF-2-like isoform X2 n=1 Tax=Pipistrellus kuhlii TaxID=59472 RepID=UPI001E2715C2|nr:translation initiation factor IF-2-like isoform X2 [Pipistrellus kuhlii]
MGVQDLLGVPAGVLLMPRGEPGEQRRRREDARRRRALPCRRPGMLRRGLPPPKAAKPRGVGKGVPFASSGAVGKSRVSSEVSGHRGGRSPAGKPGSPGAGEAAAGLGPPRLRTRPRLRGELDAAHRPAGAKGIRAPSPSASRPPPRSRCRRRAARSGAELPPRAATEEPGRERWEGGSAGRPPAPPPPFPPPLPPAAGGANPAAAAPAAPGCAHRGVPAAPRREEEEKPSRGPSIRARGAGACSFLARLRGGGGAPGRRAGGEVGRAAGRASSLAARSLAPRRRREGRGVGAVRGCARARAPPPLPDGARRAAGPTLVGHTRERGRAGGGGRGTAGAHRPREWASPGGEGAVRAHAPAPPAALRPRAAAASAPPEAPAAAAAAWTRGGSRPPAPRRLSEIELKQQV